VANWFSDTLSIIDAETLAVVGTAAVGAGPRAFGTFIR
jgi:YVTN family beta-propeller protein